MYIFSPTRRESKLVKREGDSRPNYYWSTGNNTAKA